MTSASNPIWTAKGTCALLFKLKRIESDLRLHIPFPLDPVKKIGCRTLTGLLAMTDQNDNTHLLRLSSNVRFGSQEGYMLSDVASDSSDFIDMTRLLPTVNRYLTPIKVSCGSCRLKWRVDSGERISHRGSASLIPCRNIASSEVTEIPLLGVAGRTVQQMTISIQGKAFPAIFREKTDKSTLWPGLRGIPLGALLMRDASISISEATELTLGSPIPCIQ